MQLPGGAAGTSALTGESDTGINWPLVVLLPILLVLFAVLAGYAYYVHRRRKREQEGVKGKREKPMSGRVQIKPIKRADGVGGERVARGRFEIRRTRSDTDMRAYQLEKDDGGDGVESTPLGALGRARSGEGGSDVSPVGINSRSFTTADPPPVGGAGPSTPAPAPAAKPAATRSLSWPRRSNPEKARQRKALYASARRPRETQREEGHGSPTAEVEVDRLHSKFRWLAFWERFLRI